VPATAGSIERGAVLDRQPFIAARTRLGEEALDVFRRVRLGERRTEYARRRFSGYFFFKTKASLFCETSTRRGRRKF